MVKDFVEYDVKDISTGEVVRHVRVEEDDGTIKPGQLVEGGVIDNVCNGFSRCIKWMVEHGS